MRQTPAPLLMPIPVLTEVGYLLEREKGARAGAEFLRSIRAGQVVRVPLTAADLDRMAELVETYSAFPLGTVDASSRPPRTMPDGLARHGMQEARGSSPLSSTSWCLHRSEAMWSVFVRLSVKTWSRRENALTLSNTRWSAARR
jgi:hypothetical protein